MKLSSACSLASVVGGVFLILGSCSDDSSDDGDMMTAGSGGTMSTSGGSGGSAGSSAQSAAANPEMSFFVTSEGNPDGDLGGLEGADAKCQRLAEAAGITDKTWAAYLSADDVDGQPVNARDRIGAGPWMNYEGEMIAADLTELHNLRGSDTVVLADLMLDDTGARVNGQWEGSPDPNQHDILTGSNEDGTLAVGQTCENWTSASADQTAFVGHSDGLGPNMNPEGNFGSWNGSHPNQDCSDTAPRGGAGKFYCFAVN